MQGGQAFEPVPVRSPGGPRLGPLVAVVAIALAVAILKPWDHAPSVPTVSSSASAAPTDPASRPPAATQIGGIAEPGAAVDDLCLAPGGWRTVSYETWHDRRIRVWRAAVPGPASGPDDPTMPEVFLASSEIPAIGWCAPVVGPETPRGPAEITWWSVPTGAGGGEPVVIEPPRILPRGPASPFGALYAPPATAEAGPTATPRASEATPGGSGATLGGSGATPGGSLAPAGWKAGRYVLRYRDLDRGVDRWLALTVELIAPVPP